MRSNECLLLINIQPITDTRLPISDTIIITDTTPSPAMKPKLDVQVIGVKDGHDVGKYSVEDGGDRSVVVVVENVIDTGVVVTGSELYDNS